MGGVTVTEKAKLQVDAAEPLRNQQTPKFSAADQDIKQGHMTVARAVSKNFAKRIANALNRYTPDKRGQ
jgi:hypothetical protein